MAHPDATTGDAPDAMPLSPAAVVSAMTQLARLQYVSGWRWGWVCGMSCGVCTTGLGWWLIDTVWRAWP